MARLGMADISHVDRRDTVSYLPVIGGGIIVLLGLYLTRLYSYLLFHSLVEIFSVGVAFSVFTVFWNSRRFVTNGFFLFLGIAYFAVAIVDLVHTLAYDGMGVFPGYGPNLPTQLWIAGRAIVATSWLAAPLFLGRHLNAYAVLAGHAACLALLFGLIFYWEAFPVCYVEGVGLTPFKMVSEYVISAVLAAAIIHVSVRRHALAPDVYQLLVASLLITIASDLSFTLYIDVYGVANMAGHFFKLVSYYLIYRVFVEVALTQPFALLFRDLKHNEAELKTLNETLEQRVVERTAVAEQRANQLRALAWELTQTEQHERRRLAQVLHDHLQQLLFAAKLAIARLQRRESSAEQRHSLTQIDEMLQEAINASRSLTVELSPPILYDAGLPAALEWLARQVHDKHHLAVRAETDQDIGPIDDDTAALLFQAVRELLFNVVKHAQAASATVQLHSSKGDKIRLVVSDSGIGFDLTRTRDRKNSNGGFGLFSMRERLELIGGEVEIQSSPGNGTQVILTAPREKLMESRPSADQADEPPTTKDSPLPIDGRRESIQTCSRHSPREPG